MVNIQGESKKVVFYVLPISQKQPGILTLHFAHVFNYVTVPNEV